MQALWDKLKVMQGQALHELQRLLGTIVSSSWKGSPKTIPLTCTK